MKKLILTLLVALPMSVFAQKFGHFDSSLIIQSMPEYAAAQSRLDAKAKEYEAQLQRMNDEWRQKYDAYTKEQATMTDAQKQEREQELQEQNQRQSEFYNQFQKELEQAQLKEISDIRNKVSTAVEEVGKAGGYVYIMDTTAGIPYISNTLSIDVTAQLKAKLGIK